MEINWTTIVLSNPLGEWIVALAILFGVLVVNQFLARLITRVFYQFFKRYEKENHFSTFNAMLASPIKWTIFLVALAFIAQRLNFPEVLNIEIFSRETAEIARITYRVLLTITISWILLRFVKYFFTAAYSRALQSESKQDDQIILFLKDLVQFAIILIAFALILRAFGVNISGLLAGAGIAGLAIAFAAKDTLENLIASVVIFLEKPFLVGDFISIGGERGSVERVGFRSTRLRTPDKTYVTVPNRSFINTNIDNLTDRVERRVNFTLGLVYETPDGAMKEIITQLRQQINTSPFTTDDCEVHFFGFGESSLDIRITYFLSDIGWAHYLDSRQRINFQIMKIVKDNGSDFAYPTRVVYSK